MPPRLRLPTAAGCVAPVWAVLHLLRQAVAAAVQVVVLQAVQRRVQELQLQQQQRQAGRQRRWRQGS